MRRVVARRLRDELGVTGKDLAEVFRYTHQWVSNLRTDDRVSA